MPDELFPCIASVTFFVLLFGFLAFMRYMRYRETMTLAEKGLVRMPRVNGNGKDTLRWGIAITAIGLALCVGLYPIGAMTRTTIPFGFGPWMLVGLLPTFFGLGLVLIYVLTKEEKSSGREGEGKDSEMIEPPVE